MSNLNAKEYKRFEEIKNIRSDGSEFWSARELALCLEYTEWRNFTKVIERAMIACKNSGHEIDSDFVEVNKIVEMPTKPRKDGKIGFVDLNKTKKIKNYKLTRYAC